MLNKKNIAKAMAAATVLTATPVFAAETEADVVARVKATAITGVKKGDEKADQLIKDLRFLLTEGTKYEVARTSSSTVTEIKVGESVYNLYYSKTTTSTVGMTLATNVLAVEEQIEKLGKDESLYIVLQDKGHATVKGKISGTNASGNDIPETKLATIEVDNTVSTVKNYTLADFYDGEYLTAEGLDFITVLRGTIDTNKYDSIKLVDPADTKKTTTSLVDGIVLSSPSSKEHNINMAFRVDYLDDAKEVEDFAISITGTDLQHVKELYDYLVDPTTTGAYKIAGADRFETAVAIANQNYTAAPSGIVLVNAKSMIDGLTAAPLAAQLNNPVLLTNVNELPKATLDYIKNKNIKNVTVVGGEAAVSNEVKRELEQMGVKVERIGGKDRHYTSLEVAIKLESLGVNLGDKTTSAGTAYVVAATGEADAMSIAPKAAATGNVAPIIVEGFDGMSTTANELLKHTKTVDLIGGKVSEETQIAYDKKGDFIAGADRFETNAKIVRNYFNNVEQIYVAKDGYTEGNNEMLVDALAVGSLAGKSGQDEGAIVLASKELTAKQKEAIQLVKKNDNTTTVTQVGGGVKHSVIKQVAKMLGFTK